MIRLIEFICICIAFFGIHADNLFIAIIGLGLGCLVLILDAIKMILDIIKKAEQKEEKDRMEKLNREKKQCVEFYEKCKEMNILDSNKESNRAKMCKIAESLYGSAYSFYNNDIEKMIEIAKIEIAEKIEKKQKDDEKKQHEELTKYSESIGNKREMMLLDLCAKYKKDADDLSRVTSAVIASSQKEEKDWAIAGGIADGIAGAGAGIATALSVQAENERIRQQNKANMESLSPYISLSSNLIIESKLNYHDAYKLYEECRIKLFDTKMDENELLSKLNLKVVSEILNKDTNTLLIEVSVGKCKKFTIYEDVEAVVDGTISADIYQDNKKVGSALLVLPIYGAAKASKVKGICLSKVDASKPYDIKFTPYHLWGMEI